VLNFFKGLVFAIIIIAVYRFLTNHTDDALFRSLQNIVAVVVGMMIIDPFNSIKYRSEK
jgi:hypothetical protein